MKTVIECLAFVAGFLSVLAQSVAVKFLIASVVILGIHSCVVKEKEEPSPEMIAEPD